MSVQIILNVQRRPHLHAKYVRVAIVTLTRQDRVIARRGAPPIRTAVPLAVQLLQHSAQQIVKAMGVEVVAQGQGVAPLVLGVVVEVNSHV